MIYKNFAQVKLSALGLGCMRLPTKDGDPNAVDIEKTAEMVDYALKNGVNYFDTAWGYHGGNSETAMGEVLSRYPRESYFLASKFPGYDISTFENMEGIFNKQLEKCRTEYFDFYLCHNVNEKNIDYFLSEKFAAVDTLCEYKKQGKIRHLGFSAHAELPALKRFLEAVGDRMEFCQLQINYIDWTWQSAKEKLDLVHSYGIPVWVMEPLRGGKLACLPEKHEKERSAKFPDMSAVQTAFRFLQSIDDVCVTLSGMSNMEQLKDNIEIFASEERLSEEEFSYLVKLGASMIGAVPCTECRYCTEYCRMGLDIPYLLRLYNEHTYTGGGWWAPMMVSNLPEDKRPQACVGCGECERVCPQSIKIPQILKEFVSKL